MNNNRNNQEKSEASWTAPVGREGQIDMHIGRQEGVVSLFNDAEAVDSLTESTSLSLTFHTMECGEVTSEGTPLTNEYCYFETPESYVLPERWEYCPFETPASYGSPERWAYCPLETPDSYVSPDCCAQPYQFLSPPDRQKLRVHTLVAITCQSAIRRYLSMKAFKQVLRANTVTRIIQTKWREVRTRQRFTATKFLVIKVQAVFRGVIVRKSVVIQTRNAIQIQTAWRRHCALIRYATEVHQSREIASSVLIQKTWRGFISHVDYSCARGDIIIVQAQFRQRLAMSVSKNKLRSIVIVQNTARRWFAIRRVSSMRSECEGVLRSDALQGAKLQSLEMTSAAPRLDNSQDAVAQKKLPTRHEKLQKARKKASHFHRRWKHAARLPPPPFPHNDDFVERPSGLTQNELDALPSAKESERDLPSSLPSTPDGWSDASTVSFATPPLTNEDLNRVGFTRSERERVLQSDASPGAKEGKEELEELPFSPVLLNRSLLVSSPSTLASPRSTLEHSPSLVASSGANDGEDDSSLSRVSSSTGIEGGSLWTPAAASESDEASMASPLSVATVGRRAEAGMFVNGSGVELYVGQDILRNGNMFERGRIIRLIHEVPLKAEVSWSGSLCWNAGWSNTIVDCSELQPVILPVGRPRQQGQHASEEDSSLPLGEIQPTFPRRQNTDHGNREEDSSDDESLLGDFQPTFSR